MPSIRIIQTPPGEAPEAIRRAWIGTVIDLPENPSRRWRTHGPVMATPRRLVATMRILWGRGQRHTRWDSYAVEAMAAFDALRDHDPEAFEWWRVNAPHVMRPGRKIEFPARVCEMMETAGNRD